MTRQVEIRVKYAGYLQRQEQQIEAFRREESRLLPENADYASIAGLRLEARQKLARHPPALHRAGRAHLRRFARGHCRAADLAQPAQ